ncbi:MAG: SDR family oxidoreductase [Chlamydiales bacterium]|nr:SDR family oxidoreductase [Chlamydiales bacterium]
MEPSIKEKTGIDPGAPQCLVVGANGLIGKALVRAWNPPIATTKEELNLLFPSLDSLPIENETHLIIAAGVTKPAVCVRDPLITRKVNVEGTLKLAELAAMHGIIPVLFSTDYVFDGKKGPYSESSPHSPISEYGKQKALLENSIAEVTQGNYLLLRLSKIYTTIPDDQTLIDEIVSHLQKNERYLAATDQVFCPMHLDDLLVVLKHLIQMNKTGIYNVAGKEAVSRYDLAKTICQTLEISERLLTPVSIDVFGKDLRPKSTILETTKLFREIDLNFPTLEERILDNANSGLGPYENA